MNIGLTLIRCPETRLQMNDDVVCMCAGRVNKVIKSFCFPQVAKNAVNAGLTYFFNALKCVFVCSSHPSRHCGGEGRLWPGDMQTLYWQIARGKFSPLFILIIMLIITSDFSPPFFCFFLAIIISWRSRRRLSALELFIAGSATSAGGNAELFFSCVSHVGNVH